LLQPARITVASRAEPSPIGAKAFLVLKFMLKMIPFLYCLADAREHSAAKNYHI